MRGTKDSHGLGEDKNNNHSTRKVIKYFFKEKEKGRTKPKDNQTEKENKKE